MDLLLNQYYWASGTAKMVQALIQAVHTVHKPNKIEHRKNSNSPTAQICLKISFKLKKVSFLLLRSRSHFEIHPCRTAH